MSNYIDFLKKYESSGLNQREFGDREGLSAGMVSYYLRRARREIQSDRGSKVFSAIEVVNTPEHKNCIEISTPSGMKISISMH